MTLEFDYVVVGGGTAGAVVARRLAQDRHLRVALIEAGPSDAGNDMILTQDRWLELLGGPLDFDYHVVGANGEEAGFVHNRARMLGGCSSHNTSIMFRPPDYDLERWVREGALGWDPTSCAAALDRVEEKVPIELGPRPDPLSADFIEAAVQAGYPRRTFKTDGVVEGAGWLELAVKDRIRQSTSVCYLHPLDDLPQNLTVKTETRVYRVLFSNAKATGVETDRGEIRAHREVILCAGVFDTPKLLMLSGVGPAGHLGALGIPVLQALPGVGANLLDHPDVPINFEVDRDKEPSTYFYSDAGMVLDLDAASEGVDVMFFFGNPTFDMQGEDFGRLGERAIARTFNISVEPSHARSTGRMELTSADPYAPPRIFIDYYTDADNRDIDLTVAGIRVVRQIVRQPALAKWGVSETSPGLEVTGDKALADYARAHAGTACHPCGTCRMGSADDPMTVVGPELRVHGVDGLRIADGSIFPSITAINPAMTTMMIGERCAEFLLSATSA